MPAPVSPKVLAVGLAVVAAGGCRGASRGTPGGAARTAAASQPTPAAFDPAQSDPEAIATVDAAIAKLGGAAAWASVKELRFTVSYRDGDEVKAQFEHAWDRWNGRHRFSSDGRIVAYDLFGQSTDEAATIARQRLAEDAYFLAIVYKMKDPGVTLGIDNENITIGHETLCQPSCISIKVSFDPAVGKDSWFVNFNNASGLPEVIEKQVGDGRIGYAIEGWVDAGGLKWPTKLQNLGLPSEVIELSGIAVGEPADATYQPTVQ